MIKNILWSPSKRYQRGVWQKQKEDWWNDQAALTIYKPTLDKISKDVIEATKSLEFTQSTLNEELDTLKNGIKELASDMKELENNILNPNEVSEKLIALEDRSWRNNLHIDVLIENTSETWEDYEKRYRKYFEIN